MGEIRVPHLLSLCCAGLAVCLYSGVLRAAQLRHTDLITDPGVFDLICRKYNSLLAVIMVVFQALALLVYGGSPDEKKKEPPEPDILLACSFTNGTLRAEYAAGNPQGENEHSDYVEFRATVRGKGIYLGQNVAIRFLAEGNIRQDQGTLEFWVTYPGGKDISKWDKVPAVEYGVLFTFKEEGNNGFYIYKQSNDKGYMAAPNSEGKIDHSCPFVKQNWRKAVSTHLAFTWNASGYTSFVDGRQQYTSKGPFLRTQADSFYLGPGINSFGYLHSNAIVQDLRIFSRALDSGEIYKRYLTQRKE